MTEIHIKNLRIYVKFFTGAKFCFVHDNRDLSYISGTNMWIQSTQFRIEKVILWDHQNGYAFLILTLECVEQNSQYVILILRH
jgi:hypothetical protein